ncbi:transposase [Clostridioides difficile]|uniref:transposase n=1 Tax=Clostridioides difficile TaxID=1496 RepID=UPI003A905695
MVEDMHIVCQIQTSVLWGRHLWNPSYFVATVSENTEEQIRKYINNQKKQVK